MKSRAKRADDEGRALPGHGWVALRQEVES
jgi:hypothetical protein